MDQNPLITASIVKRDELLLLPLDRGVELVLQILPVLHGGGLGHLVIATRPLTHLLYTQQSFRMTE